MADEHESLHRYLLLFAALLVGCSAVGLTVEWRRSAESSARRLRASDANRTTLELLNLVLDAQSSQFSYVLTGDAAQLEALRRLTPQMPVKLRQLKTLDSPETFKVLEERVERVQEAMADSVRLRQREGVQAATEMVRGGRQAQRVGELREEIASLSQRYFAVRNEEATRQQEAIQKHHAVSVAVSLLILGLLLGATSRIEKLLKKLRLSSGQIALERDRYQRLADRIERVREEERASLARELHDDIGQMLTVLQIDLGSLPTAGRAEEGVPVIERASRAVSEIIRKTRQVATLLRPPLLDQLGVVAAIEWQVNELKKRGNSTYSFRATVDELPELDADLRVGMFRVAQEALTNAARHSGASKVDIRIYREKNAAVLEIQDNGRGFSVEEADRKGTLGLTGMEERARNLGAQLTVETESGRGTTVRFSAPLRHAMAGGAGR